MKRSAIREIRAPDSGATRLHPGYTLTQAMRHLPAGTAYAVWTGIGGVGVAAFGILAFGDSASPLRLLCIGMIVAGIVGLRLLEA